MLIDLRVSGPTESNSRIYRKVHGLAFRLTDVYPPYVTDRLTVHTVNIVS